MADGAIGLLAGACTLCRGVADLRLHAGAPSEALAPLQALPSSSSRSLLQPAALGEPLGTEAAPGGPSSSCSQAALISVSSEPSPKGGELVSALIAARFDGELHVCGALLLGGRGLALSLSGAPGCLGLSAVWGGAAGCDGACFGCGREVGRTFPTGMILQTSLGAVCFCLFLLFAGVLVGLSSHPRGGLWSLIAFHCLNFQKHYRVKFPLNFLCWSFGPVLQFHQGQNEP